MRQGRLSDTNVFPLQVQVPYPQRMTYQGTLDKETFESAQHTAGTGRRSIATREDGPCRSRQTVGRQTRLRSCRLFFVPGFRIRTRASGSRCNLALLFFTVLNSHLRDIVPATLTTTDEHKSGNSFAEATDRRYCILRDWQFMLTFPS